RIIYPEVVERERPQRLRGAGGELNAEDIETVVERYTLAYRIHTALENGKDETRHTDYVIDAQTGAIVQKWSTLHTAAFTGGGKSQYSGLVNLGADSVAGGFELRDVARSMHFETYDLNHASNDDKGTIYRDDDDTWGDGANYIPGGSTTGDNGQTAAVDAHY